MTGVRAGARSGFAWAGGLLVIPEERLVLIVAWFRNPFHCMDGSQGPNMLRLEMDSTIFYGAHSRLISRWAFVNRQIDHVGTERLHKTKRETVLPDAIRCWFSVSRHSTQPLLLGH